MHSFAFALRSTDANGQIDTARLIRGIGIAAGDVARIILAGKNLTVLAVDACALARADCTRSIGGSNGGGSRGQQFQARILGILTHLQLLLRRLNRTDDGAGQGQRQTALLELGFGRALGPGLGCADVDFLRIDIDIADGSNDVTSELLKVLPGVDVHIPLIAAHGRRGGALARSLLIHAELLRTQGHAETTGGEQAGFLLHLEVGFPGAVGGGLKRHIVLRIQIDVVGGHDVGALDADVGPGREADTLRTQRTGECRSLADLIARGGGLAGEETTALAHMRFVQALRGFAVGDRDVITGGDLQSTGGTVDGGSAGADVVTGGDLDIVFALNR